MIALFDFAPKFCPNCGKNVEPKGYTREDFFANASFSCNCGLSYQHCDSQVLVEAARETGGDLYRYVAESA